MRTNLKQFNKYMIEKLHYKEIYLLVKQDLLRFTDSLFIGKEENAHF